MVVGILNRVRVERNLQPPIKTSVLYFSLLTRMNQSNVYRRANLVATDGKAPSSHVVAVVVA